MHGTSKAFLALVLLGALQGCNTAPMKVRQTYEAPHSAPPQPVSRVNSARLVDAPPRSAVPAAAWCELQVESLVDNRLDPTTFGQVGRVIKAPDDMQAWMRNVVGGLGTYGVMVTFKDANAAPVAGAASGLPVINAKVELLKVWMNGLATSMAANSVFKFDYFQGNELKATGTYRGNKTTTNWASGDGELQSLLDVSLRQVLEQSSVDLRRICVKS